MAGASHPVAVYAQSDAARAQPIVQTLGAIATAPIPDASLAQPIHAIGALQAQVAGADPIILLVSSASANSALFQSIALFAKLHSKRLIVIDLDNAAQGAASGNLKQLSDTVIPACDPDLPDVLEGPDRWTLPSGEKYPEQNIKRQKKC